MRSIRYILATSALLLFSSTSVAKPELGAGQSSISSDLQQSSLLVLAERPLFREWRQKRQYRHKPRRKKVRRHQRRSKSIYRKTNQYKPGLMPSRIASRGERVFIFNPRILTWGAYDASGKLIRKGHASGGSHYCRDIGRACRTPVGSFRVHAKRGANCRSSIYPRPRGGARMPYCTFFRGGYAIHGSPHVPYYNASHGCVRVYPKDAQWLHGSFLKYGTRVIVKPY